MLLAGMILNVVLVPVVLLQQQRQPTLLQQLKQQTLLQQLKQQTPPLNQRPKEILSLLMLLVAFALTASPPNPQWSSAALLMRCGD
jgi:hypothetical protein